MLVSDRLFSGNAEMAITFRAWLGVRPGEEIDLSEAEIRYWLIRGLEYTRCPDARRTLRLVEKKLLRLPTARN